MSGTDLKAFVIVGRARSSAAFAADESIRFNGEIAGMRFNIFIGNHIPASCSPDEPQGLMAEIRCEGGSIMGAIEEFANRTNGILGIISVASNAAIDNFLWELAFEVTDGITEREFVQCRVPSTAPPHPIRRRILKDPTVALISAIVQHPRSERLFRAVAHYKSTIDHWTPEDRLRCATMLFPTVEALDQIALENKKMSSRKNDLLLAQDYGIDVTKPKREWKNALMGFIRREDIFHGEDDLFKKLKHISDAYEHGYERFDELRANSHEIIIKAASHIRQSIIELAGLSGTDIRVLTDQPLHRPKGPLRLIPYVFGHLIGDGLELAAPELAYPQLDWRADRIQARQGDGEEPQMAVNWKLTARLAEGIDFRLARTEIWDGASFIEREEVPEMLGNAALTDMSVSISPPTPKISGGLAINPPGQGEFAVAVGWFMMNCGTLGLMLDALAEKLSKTQSQHRSQAFPACLRRAREAARSTEALTSETWRQLNDIAQAYHVITEGINVMSWAGQPSGKPTEQAIVARNPPKRLRHPLLTLGKLRELAKQTGVIGEFIHQQLETN